MQVRKEGAQCDAISPLQTLKDKSNFSTYLVGPRCDICEINVHHIWVLIQRGLSKGVRRYQSF